MLEQNLTLTNTFIMQIAQKQDQMMQMIDQLIDITSSIVQIHTQNVQTEASQLSNSNLTSPGPLSTHDHDLPTINIGDLAACRGEIQSAVPDSLLSQERVQVQMIDDKILKKVKQKACSETNFVVRLFRELFTEEENLMINKNVS